MKCRILILGTGQLSNNPRVLKEASTLAEAGYSVTVVGKRYLKHLDDSDRSIAEKSLFSYSYIDMLGAAPPSQSHALGLIRRVETRIAQTLVKYLRWESAAALGPSSALLRAARKIPADLTIVHNEAAHWVGLKLLGEGRKVAVDFEDWNSEALHPAEQKGCPLTLLRYHEKAILHRAIYATTASEALAQGLYERYGGQRPEVITNSFPLPPLPNGTSLLDRPPSFFWFSQTIGPGRGLEAFLAAYALTKKTSRLTLLGQICDDYRQFLLSLLPPPYRQRVSFRGLVSPKVLPSIIADHDIGLALELTDTLNHDLTISNKILQYLGAGLAVVATPTTGQCEVLTHNPQAGILLNNFDDPQTTATALDSLLADPSSLHIRQQAARRLAETYYCWEREAPRLLDLVERALKH